MLTQAEEIYFVAILRKSYLNIKKIITTVIIRRREKGKEKDSSGSDMEEINEREDHASNDVYYVQCTTARRAASGMCGSRAVG